MKLTNLKAIQSGSVVEIFRYEKPLAYEFRAPNTSREFISSDSTSREKKDDIRRRSMRRARTWLTRLIHANVGRWETENGEPYPPSFITFTFAENLTDIARANRIFTLFIKRLNFELFKDKRSIVKYVAVTEFQKRGAVHFHCVFFNLPAAIVANERTTRRIANVWGHGFVDSKDVSNVNKAIAYLTKYMLKGFDDPRLDGKKRYFGSKNLRRPKVIRLQHLVEAIIAAIPEGRKVYERVFESEYQGKTTYLKYQLETGERLRLGNQENKGTILDNSQGT